MTQQSNKKKSDADIPYRPFDSQFVPAEPLQMSKRACLRCSGTNCVSVTVHGDHDDNKFSCSACGHFWWVDGVDGVDGDDG